MESKTRKRFREEHGAVSETLVAKGNYDSFFKWFFGISEHEFFAQYFEKKPFHFSHGDQTHFCNPPTGLPAVEWSTELILRLVAEKALSYTTDVDVVKFDDVQQKRVAFCTKGTVYEKDIKRCMQDGWSVRFLRPHEHVVANSYLIAHLEEIFSCYCGLNSYWTPANSQGFAPHYDDVDVFLLQLEGEKEWLLYDPPKDVDYLSRHSSEDYKLQQLPRPMCKLRLVAGDVLYMPRGTVHQGRTFGHSHSLHVTFSANQMNTWADLLKTALTHVVEKLAANSIKWRRSLPRSLFKTLGALYNPDFRADCGLKPLTVRRRKVRQLMQSAFRHMNEELLQQSVSEEAIDECCDLYARETLAKQQPPYQVIEENKIKPPIKRLNSYVRLVAPNCARLVMAVSGEAHVYHNCGNSRICLGAPEGFLRFEGDFAPAIATILALKYRTINVSDLPFPTFDDINDIHANQLMLVNALRNTGIISVS